VIIRCRPSLLKGPTARGILRYTCRVARSSTRRRRLQGRVVLGVALGFALLASFALFARAQYNPAKQELKSPRWQAHPVAKIPSGYQVAVADVNADGRLDILALSSEASIVEWYENPSWKAHPITTKTKHNISLAPIFREGYPARGLALATEFALEDSRRGGEIWWATPRSSFDKEWSLTLIGQIPTSHRLRWANLDGSGRLALVNAPLLGAGAGPPDYNVGAPLTWYEPPEPLLTGHAVAQKQNTWSQHLIDDSLTVMHGVCVIDWDSDGRDEILSASFEGVHLFRSTGRMPNLQWSKTRLAEGDQISKSRRGASEIATGKIHGRRFLATIEPWHGEQVVVYFEGKPGELWSRHVIDDSFRDGHALAVGDLDGDGNDEIVAGYRGQGTSLHVYTADPTGTNWARQTLDTNMAAACVVIADINQDGRPDVVAIGASTGNVVWYENLR
jgi:hypothetical protein